MMKAEKPGDFSGFVSESHGILMAGYQAKGERPQQEDALSFFADECFVMADGVGGLPHAEEASRYAAETATWAYEHIRKRRYYWSDKKLFLRRIFKTVNLSLWQRRTGTEHRDSLITTMSVAIIGPRNLWVGSIGDSPVYLYRSGICAKLTDDDIDQYGYLAKAVGISRAGYMPQIITERYIQGDVLLMASDGVTAYVNEWKIKSFMGQIGDSEESIRETAFRLIDNAQQSGSKDNASVILVKRLPQTTSPS